MAFLCIAHVHRRLRAAWRAPCPEVGYDELSSYLDIFLKKAKKVQQAAAAAGKIEGPDGL
jgi:phage gp16-like protein